VTALAETRIRPSGELTADRELGRDFVAHLGQQLESARRLLQIVLTQGAAIRAREVHAVVAAAGEMHVELERRKLLEAERARLLARAGVLLGLDPGAVTLEPMCRLLDGPTAELARARSGELRGRLREIRREHHTNRALMTQQLAFLDHLMRNAELGHTHGYSASGDRARLATARLPGGRRVFDLEV
jgi:hypothetical protein